MYNIIFDFITVEDKKYKIFLYFKKFRGFQSESDIVISALNDYWWSTKSKTYRLCFKINRVIIIVKKYNTVKEDRVDASIDSISSKWIKRWLCRFVRGPSGLSLHFIHFYLLASYAFPPIAHSLCNVYELFPKGSDIYIVWRDERSKTDI